MRVATWNINSVRLRMGLVERLVDAEAPDVLCLQETKTINETFPRQAFAAKGYTHQHILGMKGYNGVAIVSRLPLHDVGVLNWQGREDCRQIFATLPNGIEIHCIYVPAGGDGTLTATDLRTNKARPGPRVKARGRCHVHFCIRRGPEP